MIKATDLYGDEALGDPLIKEFESGSMAGVFGLGMTYVRMGRLTDGAKDLQLAVSRQYRPAHNALAYLYATGKGVPENRERALALWRLSASAGHWAAKKGMVCSRAAPPPPSVVPLPMLSHREDEDAAALPPPIAKRWGSTSEAGGGRTA